MPPIFQTAQAVPHSIEVTARCDKSYVSLRLERAPGPRRCRCEVIEGDPKGMEAVTLTVDSIAADIAKALGW